MEKYKIRRIKAEIAYEVCETVKNNMEWIQNLADEEKEKIKNEEEESNIQYLKKDLEEKEEKIKAYQEIINLITEKF